MDEKEKQLMYPCYSRQLSIYILGCYFQQLLQSFVSEKSELETFFCRIFEIMEIKERNTLITFSDYDWFNTVVYQKPIRRKYLVIFLGGIIACLVDDSKVPDIKTDILCFQGFQRS